MLQVRPRQPQPPKYDHHACQVAHAIIDLGDTWREKSNLFKGVEGYWFLGCGLRVWESGLARDVQARYWEADGTFYLSIAGLITLLRVPPLDLCRLPQLK